MKFNKHSKLEGAHAFLSPSSYHWVNYEEDKLAKTYLRHLAAAKGTRLHAFASEAIELGIRLADTKDTLNLYVNDAIDFGMTPEVVLYYSENAFGTTDAISFDDGFLRIHDLKTGDSRVSMTQLKVYNALFCLEYDIRPTDIEAELRIYQSRKVLVDAADPHEISYIISKIVEFDYQIQQIRKEHYDA